MTLNHARLPIPPLRQRSGVHNTLHSRPVKGTATAQPPPTATVSRARHGSKILDVVEAGLLLRGTEVKSLREGQVTFKDSYATIRNGEAWLLGCHIAPYSHGTDANHDPERDRKLLLHGR